MTAKRSRGRPPGTGKDDSSYLAKVADYVLADPKLKPTTAMRRVIASCSTWDACDETLLRRWQVKWKAASDAFLAAAKERMNPKVVRTGDTGIPSSYGSGSVGALYGVDETVARRAVNAAVYGQGAFGALRALEGSGAIKTLQAFENSATMKVLRAFEGSAMMKAQQHMQKMQDLIDPPFLRRIRQQEKMMRDLLDPPYIRAARGLV